MFKRHLAPNLVGSCNICHGPDGTYKETLLIQHNALIQNKRGVRPSFGVGASGGGYVSASQPCGVLGRTKSAR